jgi:hypothetical protein
LKQESSTSKQPLNTNKSRNNNQGLSAVSIGNKKSSSTLDNMLLQNKQSAHQTTAGIRGTTKGRNSGAVVGEPYNQNNRQKLLKTSLGIASNT